MNKKKNYSHIDSLLLLLSEKLHSTLADIRIEYQKYLQELKKLNIVLEPFDK